MVGFINGLSFVDREVLGFASKAAGFAALRIPLQSPLLHLRFGQSQQLSLFGDPKLLIHAKATKPPF